MIIVFIKTNRNENSVPKHISSSSIFWSHCFLNSQQSGMSCKNQCANLWIKEINYEQSQNKTKVHLPLCMDAINGAYGIWNLRKNCIDSKPNRIHSLYRTGGRHQIRNMSHRNKNLIESKSIQNLIESRKASNQE
jgi:hypothetical protein